MCVLSDKINSESKWAPEQLPSVLSSPSSFFLSAPALYFFLFSFLPFFFSTFSFPPNIWIFTFISDTCSLRLGNIWGFHLTSFFSDQISSRNAGWLWNQESFEIEWPQFTSVRFRELSSQYLPQTLPSAHTWDALLEKHLHVGSLTVRKQVWKKDKVTEFVFSRQSAPSHPKLFKCKHWEIKKCRCDFRKGCKAKILCICLCVAWVNYISISQLLATATYFGVLVSICSTYGNIFFYK